MREVRACIKILIIILLFSVNSNLLSAQSTEAFFFAYGGDAYEEGIRAYELNNGSYIIAGNTSSYGSGLNDAWLLKTDSLGILLWSKTIGYQGVDHLSDMKILPNESVILAGYTNSYLQGDYDAWACLADDQGDTIWSRTYGSDNWDFFHSCRVAYDGGYCFAGSSVIFGSGDEDFYIVRTDNNGDTLWTRTFGGPEKDVAYSLCHTNDSSWVLAGSSWNTSSGEPDAMLVKFDDNGNVMWSQKIGGNEADECFSIDTCSNNNMIFSGYSYNPTLDIDEAWLFRADETGNMIWSRKYGDPNNSHAYHVCNTNDGGFAWTGYLDQFGNKDVWIFITDSIGFWVFATTHGDADTETAYSVSQTQDSGFILTGFSDSYNFGLPQLFIIKTDTIGLSIAYTGLEEKHNSTDKVLLYPNPASNFINIEAKGYREVRIFNSIGQNVLNVEINPLRSLTKLDISTLEKGIYYYQLNHSSPKNKHNSGSFIIFE